jgi:hypothetical protein
MKLGWRERWRYYFRLSLRCEWERGEFVLMTPVFAIRLVYSWPVMNYYALESGVHLYWGPNVPHRDGDEMYRYHDSSLVCRYSRLREFLEH